MRSMFKTGLILGLWVTTVFCLPSGVKAQEVVIKNQDFEEAYGKSDELVGWRKNGWGGADAKAFTIGQRKEAGIQGTAGGLVQATCTKGAQGMSGPVVQLEKQNDLLQVSVMLKPTTDYAGYRPWLFIAWDDSEHKFKGLVELKLVRLRDDGWQLWGVAVEREKIPENTAFFTLNLASIVDNKNGEPAGGVMFDQVRAQWVDHETLSNSTDWITPGAYGSWFAWGTPVVYQVQEKRLPETLTALRGQVVDSDNNPIAQVQVNREQLLRHGWSWQPTQPGLLRVRFSAQYDGQAAWQPLSRNYTLRAPNRNTKCFVIDDWQLAVAAQPALPMKQRTSQLGMSIGYNDGNDQRVADLLGMRFARFHAIGWGTSFGTESLAIEPQPGQFNWEPFDTEMARFKAIDMDVIGNVMFTPKWTSPHPEDVAMSICVINYSVYAPTNMDYWCNFLRKTVERYGKDIHTWEIWNEPNIPGGSVFWRESPEKFAELMKASYDTIKKAQPESEIWIGGMGPRSSYYAFYDHYLKSGGGNYFDKLAVHGSYATPQPFYTIDQKYNQPKRTWVNSEWHAALYQTVGGEAINTLPTEKQLASKMMFDLLQQLASGVQRIAVFRAINTIDREVVYFAYDNKWGQDWSGMFRKRPALEPRLVAVVLQNFFAGISQPLVYQGSTRNGSQHAAWFTHGNESLSVLWNTADTAITSSPAFAPMLQSAQRVRDWQGVPVALQNGAMTLEPGVFYLVSGAAPATLAALPQDASVVANPRLAAREIQEKVKGEFASASLFSDIHAPLPKLNWQTNGMQYIALNDVPRAPGFDARFAVGMTEDHLDLVVQVTDAHHVAVDQKTGYWNGDSIQFALDPDGTAMPENQVEFILSLDQGKPVLVKTLEPYIGGDLPEHYTRTFEPVVYAQSVIRQIDEQTWQYVVRVQRSELYPFALRSKSPLRFSLLINNNDGNQRAGYLQWADGIGDQKNPALYGTLSPQ